MASHDLQEPLRKIRMFSDRLLTKSKNLPEDDAKMVNRIQQAAERMQVLIVDILSFSKVSNDKSKFVESDLNVVIKDVLTDLEEEINTNNATISIQPLPSLHVRPTLMRPLFQNLISNALKYHKKDEGVNIEIRSEVSFGISERDKNLVNKYCRIFVKDNGIGFDQKYAEEIFGMFRRLHHNGEYSGTGVGLALCKKIAELHHGFISARSKIDEGSTFIVSFPLKHEEVKVS
jgi:light-regulated signal transduction histidine kinase (bacteriophytochrome)